MSHEIDVDCVFDLWNHVVMSSLDLEVLEDSFREGSSLTIGCVSIYCDLSLDQFVTFVFYGYGK